MATENKRFLDLEGLKQVVKNVEMKDNQVLSDSKDYTDGLTLKLNENGTLVIANGEKSQGESIEVIPEDIEIATINGLFSGVVWDGGEPDVSWFDEEEVKAKAEAGEKVEVSMSTAAEVAGLLSLINEGTDLSNVSVTLDEDIDFLGSTIEIGDSSSESYNNDVDIYKQDADSFIGFSGEFDGNGHTISNLNLVYTD